MVVKRIVANIKSPNPAELNAFYQDLFGLEVAMDQGWIITLTGDGAQTPQLSIASEGGSGTDVPDLSIEVDDVDAIYRKALGKGYEVVFEPRDEPWGVIPSRLDLDPSRSPAQPPDIVGILRVVGRGSGMEKGQNPVGLVSDGVTFETQPVRH